MALNPTQKKRLAVGANAGLVTALVLVGAVLTYLIAERFRVRVDVSADQASVLLPDTAQKLRLLDEAGTPVTLTAFSSQEGRPETALKDRLLRDFLEQVDRASVAVDARFVDFDKDRLTAESLGVTEYGTLVVQRGAQRVDLGDRELFRRVGKGDDRRVEFLAEGALQRAVAQLLEDRQRVVYALAGHGEVDVTDAGPSGATELARLLEREHYRLETLDLLRATSPRLPDDASALLVLRPRAAITPPEEDVLLGALARGVPLLVAVEPESPVPAVLGRLGVRVADGYVLDPLLVFPYPDRPVPRYRPHPITKDVSEQSMVTVLSRVAPLQPAVPAREGVRVTTLLETSRDGWIERGGEVVNGKARLDEGIDEKGAAAMALTAELDAASGLVRDGTARVVVLGDADVLTNGMLAEGPGNATFTVNAVRWLVGDEVRAAAVGRPAGTRRLALTQEDLDRVRSWSLGFGPVVALLLAGVAWLSRRGR